jgi:hypothetical protein
MPDPILNRWLISERIRYLGAFSSVWSGFNDFYRRDPRFQGNDRQVLTAIQSLPNTDPLVVGFEASCAQDDQRVERSVRLVDDAVMKGAVAFETQTRFSSFVSEVVLNATLGPKVWIAGQPRPHTDRTTRELPCAHLPSTEYFAWYREIRASEAEEMAMPDTSISVQDALAHRGIDSDGSAFFAAPPKISKSVGIITNLEKRLSNNPRFKTLLTFARAPQPDWVPSSRYSIALELLYLVRNNVMHGDLDPTNEANDPVGRAAYELLYNWLVEFSR